MPIPNLSPFRHQCSSRSLAAPSFAVKNLVHSSCSPIPAHMHTAMNSNPTQTRTHARAHTHMCTARTPTCAQHARTHACAQHAHSSQTRIHTHAHLRAHMHAAGRAGGGPSNAASSARTTSVLLSSAATELAAEAAAGAAAGPAEAPAAVSMPWAALEDEVRVEGSYGTKVEAILRRLAAIIAHDVTGKVGAHVSCASHATWVPSSRTTSWGRWVRALCSLCAMWVPIIAHDGTGEAGAHTSHAPRAPHDSPRCISVGLCLCERAAYQRCSVRRCVVNVQHICPVGMRRCPSSVAPQGTVAASVPATAPLFVACPAFGANGERACLRLGLSLMCAAHKPGTSDQKLFMFAGVLALTCLQVHVRTCVPANTHAHAHSHSHAHAQVHMPLHTCMHTPAARPQARCTCKRIVRHTQTHTHTPHTTTPRLLLALPPLFCAGGCVQQLE